MRVRCTGVCRTDLHILDGELAAPELPLVMGHQIVATVWTTAGWWKASPRGARGGAMAGWACGDCGLCRSGRENVCQRAEFTGYSATAATRNTRSSHRTLLCLCPARIRIAGCAALCAGLMAIARCAWPAREHVACTASGRGAHHRAGPRPQGRKSMPLLGRA